MMTRLAHVLFIAMMLAPLTSLHAKVFIEGDFQACQLTAAEDADPDGPVKKPVKKPDEEEEPECD